MMKFPRNYDEITTKYYEIPYVPASLGPVRRSIWGGYWPGIFLKLSPPEFLCLASLNLKFGAKIPKTVDFFLWLTFGGQFWPDRKLMPYQPLPLAA